MTVRAGLVCPRIPIAILFAVALSVGSAVGLAGPAAAAVAQLGSGGAQSAVPNALPVISRGVPAYTNDNCGGATPASLANDNNYNTGWRACATPSTSAPDWIAYDLSAVPVAQRGPVLVVWYNDPATLQYDYTFTRSAPPFCCVYSPYDIPRDYTLDANAAPGGAVPSGGWVTLATVTGNNYHSRQHSVNLAGYNWVRINVTATDGVTNATGVVMNLDLHNASAGYQDDWIFYGDSITEGAMRHDLGTGSFSQLVYAAEGAHFPAQEAGAIGGTLSQDGASTINTWLPMFGGQYVVIAYGTNDAGWYGYTNVDATHFYNNMLSMIQAVLAAGKIPLVPHIPWGCTSQIQTYAPLLNQQIDALYNTYPQIVRGPDLWAFFQANQNLIAKTTNGFADCVHPTADGYLALRQQWVNAALARVYATPPALVISGVQAGSIGATSATITWQTNDIANSRVDYGTTTAYGSNVSDGTPVMSHSLSLPGLTAGTTYHYRVTSVDTYGQTVVSADATFATNPTTGGATQFVLATTAAPAGGVPFSFTVTAADATGATTPAYAGTVHFTTSDTSSGVVLPADATLTNGTGTFSATLIQGGTQTITATDTKSATITGTLTVTVTNAGPASRLVLATTASPTAGAAFSFTVTAQDAAGNTATSYAGLVHFSTTDTSTGVALPGDTTLTFGKGTFSATLIKAGAQTISATDTTTASISGSLAVSVAAGPASRLVLSTTASPTAGTAFSFTVTAQDAFANTATGYAGTAHFASTDTSSGVVLPANAPLTSGTGTFSATLIKAGAQTISATDTTSASISGSLAVSVRAAAPAAMVLRAPASAVTLQQFNVTLTITDRFGNVATSYVGTAHFDSSDLLATLPPDYTFTAADAGSKTFTVTLATPMTQTITASDVANSAITPGRASVNVTLM